MPSKRIDTQSAGGANRTGRSSYGNRTDRAPRNGRATQTPYVAPTPLKARISNAKGGHASGTDVALATLNSVGSTPIRKLFHGRQGDASDVLDLWGEGTVLTSRSTFNDLCATAWERRDQRKSAYLWLLAAIRDLAHQEWERRHTNTDRALQGLPRLSTPRTAPVMWCGVYMTEYLAALSAGFGYEPSAEVRTAIDERGAGYAIDLANMFGAGPDEAYLYLGTADEVRAHSEAEPQCSMTEDDILTEALCVAPFAQKLTKDAAARQ